VSLFIDPEPAQLEAAAFVGAAAVELHTGTYAEQTDVASRRRELERLKTAAAMARRIDIECHAGHGLTFDNAGPVAAIADIIELNIGHFLVAEAMFSGLAGATRTMKQIMLLHRGRVS
jgi:pyridoxine 5-phosphate synthase